MDDWTPQRALDALADAIGDLHPYTKGKVFNAVAIPGADGLVADISTIGYSRLYLMLKMTGAAVGDLSRFELEPYWDDGVALSNQYRVVAENVPAAYGAGLIYAQKGYELRGVDKHRLSVNNANVAAQTLTVVYFMSK